LIDPALPRIAVLTNRQLHHGLGHDQLKTCTTSAGFFDLAIAAPSKAVPGSLGLEEQSVS
jgi:hypothetical protein